MNIDILGSDYVHLSGECATRSPAPCSPRHAALLVLAGSSLRRPCPCRARVGQSPTPLMPSRRAPSTSGAAAFALAWHTDHGTGGRVQLPFLG
ncbi:MAG: hypothetical protein LBE78_01690 [Burkholderiaceae bacterium]|nr:hypothetical protein [Burkholderiaceae bacterium]